MKYCEVCDIEWRTRRASCVQCGSRLQGVEGPEERLVAQAAERAERQGAGEDLRESRAVAPGEAELRCLLTKVSAYLERRMDEVFEQALFSWWPPRAKAARSEFGALLALMTDVNRTIAAKPDSEADAITSPPDLYPSIEAQTSPPTDGKRSGRRNRELSQP